MKPNDEITHTDDTIRPIIVDFTKDNKGLVNDSKKQIENKNNNNTNIFPTVPSDC